MKILSLLLASILGINAYAQNVEVGSDTIENIILNDFSKIDPQKLIDLIPYKENDLWGYIDRQTKAVIIYPKYNGLGFFNPDMNGYYQGRDFVITSDGKITVAKIEPEEDLMVMEIAADDDFRGIDILSSKNGYKGFKTDKEGKLAAYSEIYHYHTTGFPTWNVSPFKKGNKTYAIAVNKATGKYGVIDSLGNAWKGFDFNYKSILVNRYSKDKKNTWFFVEGENNRWSLINDKGEVKHRDKIMAYPLTSGCKLGYDALSNDTVSGIFDFYTMNWIVEPQSKIKIGSINYSSAVKLNTEDPKDREKATVYYWVDEGNSTYYIDLKGNRYLPKK